jgi:hypothetical protein
MATSSALDREDQVKRYQIIAGGTALIAGLVLVPGGATAFADAGASASCLGHEASAISPPGSSEELPGGMPQLKDFISTEFPGVPRGLVYRAIARLHEGSHEACDEALE